ncbi:hypothetical protein BC834DRAFT_965674 [Gloeopeniophorella convolvens]|nr:hypothetical protein BC834DRAFT_965674 [Gloeopeniophorella convolvens]
MAFQQATNKGTLVPGQTISVNKYTVQVEKYLSQGGFAHVYLVRTATPVYGTTRHVLKRIAVPNESMLSEVKKEVDIMRILKGHPNIVHLIDAAWHRTSTGIYEVFILMEFCAGGGIIDMMNRRLRERLTEADILQIFVDVCEGVAAMHNLRPALLHRDLKVENILQSSDTLYKLCDFGSANPVATRLPANTQEIRALEADLNRHTTLQYRAPEMVDPYLRRPIDEKSDVWALGVLLYKLCYYTTPFEEHGPLAILNVQYKIPSYPVYSAQLNALIASMLREHGAQRPSVFEVLITVHRMRGTRSKFSYDVPSRSQLSTERPTNMSNTLEGLVSYRSSSSPSVPRIQASGPSPSPEKNAGVQARERVLEAIAPMRRGRPTPVPLQPHAITGPSSPTADKGERATQELGFNEAEDESWKAVRGAVRGHRSGLTSPTAWPAPASSLDDAWNVTRTSAADDKSKNRDRRKTVQGAPAGFSGFGDSFDASFSLSSSAAAASSASGGSWLLTSQSIPKPTTTGQRPQETSSRFRAPSRPKDAFEGLGLTTDRAPAPTLGEVHKARSGQGTGVTGGDSTVASLAVPIRGTTSFTPNPSSPRPSPSPRLPSQAPSPAPPVSTSWRPSPSPLPQSHSGAPAVDFSVEQRFPALEELDRAFLSPASDGPPPHAASQSQSEQKTSAFTSSLGTSAPSSHSALTSSGARAGSRFTQAFSHDGGARSEQVTGSAMRESREAHAPKPERAGSHLPLSSPSRLPRLPTRAAPPKRQTSLAVRPPSAKQTPKLDEPPSPAQIMGRPEPQDWLTGPDEDELGGKTSRAVLKDSPSKRSSVLIEQAPSVPSPQEAVAVSGKRPATPPSPSQVSAWRMPAKQLHTETGAGRLLEQPRPRRAAAEQRVAAPAPADSWSPAPRRREATSTSDSSGDDGPEDATPHAPRRPFAGRQPTRVEPKETGGAGPSRRRSKSKSRQGSVHELVDLWGGKDERAKSSSGGVNSLFTGSKTFSQEPAEATSPSKMLFPPVGQLSKPRSASPAPLISPSPSNDSRRGPPSPMRQSPRHRKISTNGRDAVPPPSPSASTATARPRPQSMFLSSPSAAAARFPATSPTDNSSTGLGVPPPDARAHRATRRTSISDMVQRYEALGTQPTGQSVVSVPLAATPAPAPAPVLAPTPAPVTSGVSLMRSATTHVPSQRRSHFGAVGLPGFASAGEAGTAPRRPQGLSVTERPRPERTSPVGLPGLAIERKPSLTYGGRRSPSKFDATFQGSAGAGAGLEAPVRPVQRRSPSPVGVGRLIDQWQRKTADVEAPRSPVARRGRGGGPGTGTGAVGSPRRAGVVAVRGVQD